MVRNASAYHRTHDFSHGLYVSVRLLPKLGYRTTSGGGFYRRCRCACTANLRTINRGAPNVNWVGGDPTPHIGTILKTMRALADLEQETEVDARFLNVPMVFNSNTYYSTEAAKLLDGVIDVYLSDFKYGNDRCAKRYSHVDKYMETVTRNLVAPQHRLMIRHLVMPGHAQCCTGPIVAWVRETMRDVKFNLMFQYTPYNVTDYPEINRFVSDAERREATNIAKGLNLI